MATARDKREDEVDVSVEAAPARDWGHWVAELGGREQKRLAQFGGAVIAGVVAAVLVLYTFAWLAYEVMGQETAALDSRMLQLVQQYSSPQLTRAAEIVSLFGSELVWLIALVLLGVFAWQRRWGAAGHAMVGAAFYFYIAYLTWRIVHGWWRILVIVGLVLLVLLIGLARIYLEVHYLSDVIAGYLAGFLWTDAVILGSRGLKMRTQRRLRPRTLTG